MTEVEGGALTHSTAVRSARWDSLAHANPHDDTARSTTRLCHERRVVTVSAMEDFGVLLPLEEEQADYEPRYALTLAIIPALSAAR